MIINTKKGGSGGGVQPQDLSYSQENATVTDYIEEVDYSDDASYTRSDLSTYLSTVTEYSKSKPFAKSVTLNSGTLIVMDNAGDVCYSETISAGVYTFKNVSPKGGRYFVISNGEIKNYGTITPTGQVRMIDMGVPISNVRDLGGWTCDGGTVKYGKLFRGGDISSADRTVLVERCGVKAELNLRGNETAYDNVSPLGSDIEFCRPNHGSYVYLWYLQAFAAANKDSVKECFDFIFENIKYNRPTYFHCQGGNDRTATLGCLIEGLLGVSQYDCDKDYELSMNTLRIRTSDGTNQNINYKGVISTINGFAGNTFAQKIAIWLVSLGLSITDINAFRRSMIDGNPTDLTIPFSVTKSVSNCAVGGADASATTIDSGSSYNITLTANSGYTFIGGTITVIMGGVDVTSQVYSNGAVTIPSVSGNISITAIAVSETPTYTNLWKYTPGTGTPGVDTAVEGYRYNSTGTMEAAADTFASNTFAVPTTTYTLRIKVPNSTADRVLPRLCWCINANGSVIGGGKSVNTWFNKEHDDVYYATIENTATTPYAKFSLALSSQVAAAVVVTVNETIN